MAIAGYFEHWSGCCALGTLAAELHAELARLSRSLNTLHAALSTDNASMEDGPLLRQALEDDVPLLAVLGTDNSCIDLPVLHRALKDAPPLLATLGEAQPKSLCGHILLLLEHIKT